ncbi:unnamed protein product [Durusdinium trenchii]|uniref:Uncharacterized protein n=1 Tax=Durusdinium trenchii TaxID=1381693 RepID=A0ABP0NNB6_9DINO
MIDSTDRVIGFKWVESRTDQTGRSSGLGLPRGDLLTTMMSKQIDPDMHSVNNVISALASGPKWQEAFHMFSNIDQFRLAPDHVTHSTLIAQRMRAAVEEAQRAQLVTGVVGL